MTTLICARCKTEVSPEEARTDPEGRVYHRMCYEIAYPEAVQRDAGVTITGLDIPFFDLMVFLLKLALAGIPAGLVLGFCWYLLASACGVTR